MSTESPDHKSDGCIGAGHVACFQKTQPVGRFVCYKIGMTIFFCAKCGAALTQELEALPSVPEIEDLNNRRDPKTRRAPSTVPLGYYAIETEPWGAPYVPAQGQKKPKPAQPRGPVMIIGGTFVISAGVTNSVVVNPDDAPHLRPLTDGANSLGCCGPSGEYGLNRACPCGAPIATLTADCMGPYELHLDPVRAYAFDQ